MKLSIAASLLLAITPLSFAFAGAGDKGGHGGEKKYSRQFLFIADRLAAELAKDPRDEILARAIRVLLPQSAVVNGTAPKEILRIAPTLQPLSMNGQPIDAHSFDETKDGVLAHVVELQMYQWDRASCEEKHFITLHELLIHADLESDRAYTYTQPAISRLAARLGGIDCKKMPTSAEGAQTLLLETKGCPKRLADGIIELSAGLQSSLYSFAKTEVKTDGARSSFADDWKLSVPRSLMEASGEALVIQNLARLCLAYMDERGATPVLRKAIQATTYTNAEMAMISREVLEKVVEHTGEMTPVGLGFARTLLEVESFDRWGVATIADLEREKKTSKVVLLDQWEKEASLTAKGLEYLGQNLKHEAVADAKSLYFQATFVHEIVEALLATGKTHKAQQANEESIY